jgi:hypothetical protein
LSSGILTQIGNISSFLKLNLKYFYEEYALDKKAYGIWVWGMRYAWNDHRAYKISLSMSVFCKNKKLKAMVMGNLPRTTNKRNRLWIMVFVAATFTVASFLQYAA